MKYSTSTCEELKKIEVVFGPPLYSAEPTLLIPYSPHFFLQQQFTPSFHLLNPNNKKVAAYFYLHLFDHEKKVVRGIGKGVC